MLEQLMPLDPSLGVCNQHFFERICQFWGQLGMSRESEGFAFDEFEEIDHVGGNEGWPA